MCPVQRIELLGSPLVERLQRAFHAGQSQWVGCDWDTDFGPRRLNLRGLTSRQARLLANAMAGEESQTWHDASRWLTQVEADARIAETAARSAIAHALNNDWCDAERDAMKAIKIESSYPRPSVWQELFDAISGI